MRGKKRARSFTVLLVPDDNSKVVGFKLRGFTLIAVAILWTASVFISAFIISRHANYRATIEYNKILNEKHKAFASEVLDARESVKRTRELEAQLQAMLKLKNRAGVIKYTGFGGPSDIDTRMLEAQIKDRDRDIDRQSFEIAVKYVDEQSRAAEKSYQEIIKYVTEQRARITAVPKGWPVKGWITAGFGSRLDPFTGGLAFHEGVDIANDEGTPVKATADGVVTQAGFERGYGNVVNINHANGYMSRYGHMQKYSVATGQHVKKGQTIGYLGNTGRSTAPHLHYEVRLNGVSVNPVRFMREEVALK